MTSAAPEDAWRVLIDNNDLLARFARVPDAGHFVLAETGFGNGINFLAAWQTWRQSEPSPHICLHFICVDPNPLSRRELERDLEQWPELSPLADELIANYPAPVAGTHRLVLDGGRVRLTLCFGDVDKAWQQLGFTADAWILHDFGPSPLSDQKITNVVARHSGPGTSFAALTSDEKLGPLLSEAGFSVSGGADNRERTLLTGHIPCTKNTEAGRPPSPGTIGIVGAGIAGSLLANNLAGRGLDVTLIDQADSPAAAASGNRQGALYVKLGVDYNDQAQLALSSLLFSQRFYRRFEGKGWHPTGLIQLAYNAAEQDRQARFLAKNQYPSAILEQITADQATRIAGIPVPHGGLWFPASGWLQPTAVCRSLCDQPEISHRFGFQVTSLKKTGLGWTLMSGRGDALTFDQVVICAGPDTPELIPLTSQYRMKRIRGQITEVPEEHLNSPQVVVCGPGYINPAHDGSALVGATFDLHDPAPEVTAHSDRENLEMLSGLLPEVINAPELPEIARKVRGRVAFRCTTHDYQPVAGPMKTREGDLLEGVYVFTGLGSKGLTYSPLLAEYLGDLISAQPACLPANLVKRVETQRCHRQQVP